MRSIRICLTISPRYIPLVIFSYLFGEGGDNTDEDIKMVSKDPGLGVESVSHGPEWPRGALSRVVRYI